MRKPALNWMYVSQDRGLVAAFSWALLPTPMPKPRCQTVAAPATKSKSCCARCANWSRPGRLGKRTPCRSKWGTDFHNPYSQNIYAGYFYVSGLDGARALFKIVRQAIDRDPKLGPEVAMSIKRGCSEYEGKLGPSDRYSFTPEMAAVEANLKARFRPGKEDYHPSMVAAQWIETAFRLGDDTYLDFTGGKAAARKAWPTIRPEIPPQVARSRAAIRAGLRLA